MGAGWKGPAPTWQRVPSKEVYHKHQGLCNGRPPQTGHTGPWGAVCGGRRSRPIERSEEGRPPAAKRRLRRARRPAPGPRPSLRGAAPAGSRSEPKWAPGGRRARPSRVRANRAAGRLQRPWSRRPEAADPAAWMLPGQDAPFGRRRPSTTGRPGPRGTREHGFCSRPRLAARRVAAGSPKGQPGWHGPCRLARRMTGALTETTPQSEKANAGGSGQREGRDSGQKEARQDDLGQPREGRSRASRKNDSREPCGWLFGGVRGNHPRASGREKGSFPLRARKTESGGRERGELTKATSTERKRAARSRGDFVVEMDSGRSGASRRRSKGSAPPVIKYVVNYGWCKWRWRWSGW